MIKFLETLVLTIVELIEEKRKNIPFPIECDQEPIDPFEYDVEPDLPNSNESSNTTTADDSDIRELMLRNKDGFGKCNASKRDSIHIFPVNIKGKRYLRLVFVVSTTDLIDWKDIDNLFRKNGELNKILFKIADKKVKRKGYVRLEKYGADSIDTWVPLCTEIFPPLNGESGQEFLYKRDKSLIEYMQAIKDKRIDMSKNNDTFTSETWLKFNQEINKLTKSTSVIFPTNDCIFTISYKIPIDNIKLGELDEVLENEIYGLPIRKNGVEVLLFDNIYFHSSSRYQDGMFSERLILVDGNIKREKIKF